MGKALLLSISTRPCPWPKKTWWAPGKALASADAMLGEPVLCSKPRLVFAVNPGWSFRNAGRRCRYSPWADDVVAFLPVLIALFPLLQPEAPATQRSVESLLQKFAAQELIEVKRGLLQDDDQPMLVTYADHSKLSAMMGAVAEKKGLAEGLRVRGVKRRAEQEAGTPTSAQGAAPSALVSSEPLKEPPKKSRKQASDLDLEIESLLSQQSTKEQQSKKVRPWPPRRGGCVVS